MWHRKRGKIEFNNHVQTEFFIPSIYGLCASLNDIFLLCHNTAKPIWANHSRLFVKLQNRHRKLGVALLGEVHCIYLHVKGVAKDMALTGDIHQGALASSTSTPALKSPLSHTASNHHLLIHLTYNIHEYC